MLPVGSAVAEPTLGSLDAPTVTRGLDKLPDGWPAIVVTKTGIVFEGKAIVSVTDGDVAPDDKEGGALGMKISRLSAFATALVTSTKPPPAGFMIALDQSTPYRLFMEILFSAKQAPMKHFGLACKTGTSIGSLPVTLPDRAPDKASAKRPAKPALGLVVAMTVDKLHLWSMSGTEGTPQKPRLVVARTELATLTGALAQIVKRRFGTAKRTDENRQILVMADPGIPMKDVVGLLVAVRTAADGTELFPDVVLSSGFE